MDRWDVGESATNTVRGLVWGTEYCKPWGPRSVRIRVGAGTRLLTFLLVVILSLLPRHAGRCGRSYPRRHLPRTLRRLRRSGATRADLPRRPLRPSRSRACGRLRGRRARGAGPAAGVDASRTTSGPTGRPTRGRATATTGGPACRRGRSRRLRRAGRAGGTAGRAGRPSRGRRREGGRRASGTGG